MADILSQEEIDALLEVVDDDGGEDVLDNEEDLTSQKKIALYDFKRPNRVSKEQLRAIRGLHDKLSRGLASTISAVMRTIVEVQLHSVDQMTYGEFLMSLPSPTSFNILKDNEDRGVILEINPNIAFPIIDRLLGGGGEPFESSREFTDIESNVFKQFLDINMIPSLNNIWGTGFNPLQIGESLSSPNIVQIVPQNEFVIMCVMEIVIGGASGMMNICYPVQQFEHYLEATIGPNTIKGNRSNISFLKGIVSNIRQEIPIGFITLCDFKTIKVGKSLVVSNNKSALKQDNYNINDLKVKVTYKDKLYTATKELYIGDKYIGDGIVGKHKKEYVIKFITIGVKL